MFARLLFSLISLLLLASSQVLIAQSVDYEENYSSDIFIQAGFKQDYHRTYQNILISPAGSDTSMVRETNYPFAMLGYRKFFGKLISVSIGAAYNSSKKETTRTNGVSGYHERGVGMLATAQVYWFRRKAFKLYSGLGSGIIFSQYSSQHDDLILYGNTVEMNLILSPIGFRLGKKIGITGEYSWSDLGRYQLGLFYNW